MSPLLRPRAGGGHRAGDFGSVRRLKEGRMRDGLYENVRFTLSEIPHRYGPNVHLLSDPILLSQLALLCAKGTHQPEVNRLVASLYTDLVKTVINAEFPRKMAAIPTRMIDSNPHAIYQGEVIDREVRAVAVNIARAGTLPSQVTYDLLNNLISPSLVRQDHIIMSRMIDASERVVGSAIGGAKIGGDVDDAIRLDRALSAPKVFDTVAGQLWDQERGLDDRQYIVPGGGGFGELMNNAYV